MKYFNQAKKYGSNIISKEQALAIGLALVGMNANAALDAAVGTSITALTADIVALIALGYAFVAAVKGGWVTLGWFSKILGKR
jgi:hypothetical protein